MDLALGGRGSLAQLRLVRLALALLRGGLTGATPLWNPHFIETLEGSFSSVSTATIARVGAFFRVFQDLQDLHSFAPLRTQFFKAKFQISSEKSTFFSSELANLLFLLQFIVFLTDFDEKYSGFHQIFRNLQNFIQNFIEIANLK